jgi:hypothetical protein
MVDIDSSSSMLSLPNDSLTGSLSLGIPLQPPINPPPRLMNLLITSLPTNVPPTTGGITTTAATTVNGSRQRYILPSTDECSNTRAVGLSRILLPSSSAILGIVTVLRQHIVFNELFQSCFVKSSQQHQLQQQLQHHQSQQHHHHMRTTEWNVTTNVPHTITLQCIHPRSLLHTLRVVVTIGTTPVASSLQPSSLASVALNVGISSGGSGNGRVDVPYSNDDATRVLHQTHSIAMLCSDVIVKTLAAMV